MQIESVKRFHWGGGKLAAPSFARLFRFADLLCSIVNPVQKFEPLTTDLSAATIRVSHAASTKAATNNAATQGARQNEQVTSSPTARCISSRRGVSSASKGAR
jgi:hypothetical protein